MTITERILAAVVIALLLLVFFLYRRPAGGSGSCMKYTVPHTAVQASAGVKLFDLPAHGKITGLTLKHSVAFAGTGIGGVTVSIGTDGAPSAYAQAFDVAQPVSDTAMHDDGGHYSVTYAAHPVMANFTATGAALSALTAGSLDVCVCTVALP
jgi:hypothetical protein